MSTEIVSIITPSFNRADLVMETAVSIRSQNYPHWEWVIVDDGSTDNSWSILTRLAEEDARIKVFRRDREPKGACTCRNIAVSNSTGKYLIFLDTDDVLAPFCLEQRVAAIERSPGLDFVIFPMLLFKKELDDLNTLWNIDNEKDDLHRILTGDAVCQGTGTIWRKDSFVKAGMWREDLHLWQDIELHIRSLLFPMRYEKRFDLQPDVFLRVTDGSLSRSGYYSLPKIKSRVAVFSYSCMQIKEKGKLPAYADDLRSMALDIALSALFAAQFRQANMVLELARSLQLIEQKEWKLIQIYMWFRRFKLYKLRALDAYLAGRLNRLRQTTTCNIGQVRISQGYVNNPGSILQASIV